MVSDVIETNKTRVVFVGVVSRIKEITTKNSKTMAFVEMEDVFESIDTTLFPDTYTRYKSLLKVGSAYLISGKREIRNNKIQILIDDIKEL